MKKLLRGLLPKSTVGLIAAYMHKPKKAYSDAGEDSVIDKIFRRKPTGFYVDIGCFHPTVANNTLRLYKRGWNGINIDVDAYKIDLFNRVRKRDTNICVAISDQAGIADFYFHDGESYGSMSSLVKSEAERKAKGLGRAVLSRRVETIPLREIFEREGVTHVDVMSVDVEGAEEMVLSTIDFDVISVDVLAVEIHGDRGEVMATGVHALLVKAGYEVAAWTPPTVFYRKPRTDAATLAA